MLWLRYKKILSLRMVPDYKKAEKIAHELLVKYGFNDPLINVVAIAQYEGLEIKEFDEDDQVKLKNTAGFFDPATRTIYINKNDPPNRKTFTIAHELGHFKLEHDASRYGVLPRWQVPGIEKEPIEKEADCFAANLLVPEDMLKKVMKDYELDKKDTSLLCNMFGVSEDVIRFRLMRI